MTCGEKLYNTDANKLLYCLSAATNLESVVTVSKTGRKWHTIIVKQILVCVWAMPGKQDSDIIQACLFHIPTAPCLPVGSMKEVLHFNKQTSSLL